MMQPNWITLLRIVRHDEMRMRKKKKIPRNKWKKGPNDSEEKKFKTLTKVECI